MEHTGLPGFLLLICILQSVLSVLGLLVLSLDFICFATLEHSFTGFVEFIIPQAYSKPTTFLSIVTTSKDQSLDSASELFDSTSPWSAITATVLMELLFSRSASNLVSLFVLSSNSEDTMLEVQPLIHSYSVPLFTDELDQSWLDFPSVFIAEAYSTAFESIS